jgi:hypothetical protein
VHRGSLTFTINKYLLILTFNTKKYLVIVPFGVMWIANGSYTGQGGVESQC